MLADFDITRILPPSPITWRKDTLWNGDRSRYTADNLPAIRRKNGVGRPPRGGDHITWAQSAQMDHVNMMVGKTGATRPYADHRYHRLSWDAV